MNKKFSFKSTALTYITLCIFQSAFSQDTCIVTKRGTENGFDSYLTSFAANVNCVNHTDFGGVAWTCNSAPCYGRCVIQFYLPPVPTGYMYTSASLDLFSNPAPYSNGGQAAMLGPNECVLQRITSPWVDNTVTWNNQPTTTATNQVLLPASTASVQDYLNIDMTNLIADIYSDLSQNYGFMISLTDETEYRNMIFASSEVTDSTKHPRLEICFSSTTGIKPAVDNSASINFDNETNNLLISTRSHLSTSSIKLFTIDAKRVNVNLLNLLRIDNNKASINLNELSSGIYFVQVNGMTKKFVKQ